MSVVDKLASALGRNDEEPNLALARDIAARGSAPDVRELVQNLSSKQRGIASDCVKVLYEIGAIKPELIADYTEVFVGLLKSRDNRLVWGGMTALGAIAPLKPHELWKHVETLIQATEDGSVITQDWGIRVLAAVSAADLTYEARIFPFLMHFLKNCRPKDLPRHAESLQVAITPMNRKPFLEILEDRQPSLLAAQSKRVAAVIKAAKAL
jgi:hypothetical protein